jgi:hypothetical protein
LMVCIGEGGGQVQFLNLPPYKTSGGEGKAGFA